MKLSVQIIDVAHLPPAEFFGELLLQIDDRAQRGDRIAAAVRDRLRVLVVGDDLLFKLVTAALQGSHAGKSIAVGCIPAGGRSDYTKALGLSLAASDVSQAQVFELLKEVVNAGTQNVDCWEVTLSNHRKRAPSRLPAALQSVSLEGGSEWVVVHQGLCWSSLHLEMGYVNAGKEGDNGSGRQKKSWLCGLCSAPEPEVIRSQTVGRLEIKRGGEWSYLELSPQIQSLEFLNLAEENNKERRKMKMLERGNLEAFSDDGLIEIVGVKEGSDEEICLAQANAVRLELSGNVEIDHVKLRLDSETWTQPLAGESTTHPTVIQIDHARHAPVLVSQTLTLKCAAPPVFRAPLFVPPQVETTPPEKAPGLFRRSASPFRKTGRFRSASPFRKGGSFRRSRSPAPRRTSENPSFEMALDASEAVRIQSQSVRESSDGVRTPSGGVQEPSDGVQTPPGRVRELSDGIQLPSGTVVTKEGVIVPGSKPANGGFFGSKGRRAQSPVPGARIHDDREVRAAVGLSDGPKRPVSAPGRKSPKEYTDAAAAAAKGQGVISRRPAASIPWTLKSDKLVDADRVQPQQKLGRTLSGSGSGRQEIIEPVAKTLVRTGSGRLAGDDPNRPPSPALYRSSSRENLESALSRPVSPRFIRSASRDNLEQTGGSLSRPPSPSPLSRQNSGNAAFSPRVTITQMSPRSESFREPTPERLPRMADWATGMSRKPASMVYHTHLLTKQEREQVVVSGFGSTLSREERERMQSLAFGNTPGYERGTVTPMRIRSARARYVTPAGSIYSVTGPLELDLATPGERTESPPPPVRTARDFFSGPLGSNGLPSVRRSAVL